MPQEKIKIALWVSYEYILIFTFCGKTLTNYKYFFLFFTENKAHYISFKLSLNKIVSHKPYNAFKSDGHSSPKVHFHMSTSFPIST